jgi:hypothetical protein
MSVMSLQCFYAHICVSKTNELLLQNAKGNFNHPAIVSVAQKAFFPAGKSNSLGSVFPIEMGSTGRGVPYSAIALCCAAVS